MNMIYVVNDDKIKDVTRHADKPGTGKKGNGNKGNRKKGNGKNGNGKNGNQI